LSRLSFNSMTADRWSLVEVIDACAEHGVGWIGPWRHKLAEIGVREARKRIDDAGLQVSSLCRGGFFAQEGAAEDNRRAVEEAAALGTNALVLVCGPPSGKNLAAARDVIEAGIEDLLPYANEHGVRLGIEPLHPMMVGERSAINTLGNALDICERIGDPGVGVVIDVYHTFWDPDLPAQIERARGRIVGYHVNDWLRATRDTVWERGMMGDGIIDLPAFTAMIDAAGYDGPIEVEILNPAIWDLPREELMRTTVERFERCVF
jgi:sugar phosphate isomerase/epimerase